MKLVLGSMFALVLPVVLAGQGPEAPTWPVDSLPQHLASEDLVEVAWASHLVQRDRVRTAVPAVRHALARLAGNDGFDGRLARLHLLDALIQLDVRVPSEELLPHAIEDLRIAALVLAAKAARVNSRYFATRFAATADSPDLEWHVCGNLLTFFREPGFTLACVQAIQFPLRIEVTDRKECTTGVG